VPSECPLSAHCVPLCACGSQAAKLSKYHLTEGVSALGYLRPEMRPYVIEVQLVGCRDVPPREVLGAPVFLTSPYEITP
jgi:hypothetical protein